MTNIADRDNASFFFWLSLSYLLVLAALAIVYQVEALPLDEVEDPLAGVLPLGVPWFGALGAVSISLYGVFEHSDNWDRRYNYWHVARPIMGVVLGTLAYFIFIGLINATGNEPVVSTTTAAPGTATTPTPDNAGATTNSSGNLIPYFVLAFIVGFREHTFRTLISRATDLLFGPGIPGVTPGAGVAVSPSPVGPKGLEARAGAQVDKEVTVTNVGSGMLFVNDPGASPRGTDLRDNKTVFALVDNVVEGATVAAGASVGLKVRFSPQQPGEYRAELVINTNVGSISVRVTGRAT